MIHWRRGGTTRYALDLTLLTLLLLGGASVARADVEAELTSRFKGLYALTQVPIFSECTKSYTDNDVTVTGAARGKGRRIAPGELARIDKVAITFSTIDVYLGASEPVLVSWTDGPFTLYDQPYCKMQLKLAAAGDVRRDLAKAVAAVEKVVAVYRTPEEAKRTSGWNGRRCEPYPKGWEQTKAEYAAWKLAQTNRAVQAKIDEAIDQANQAMERVNDGADALAAFAAGVRARRDESFGSCESMLGATFYAHGSSGKEERAHAEGQRLAFYLALARELRKCFVEPPPG